MTAATAGRNSARASARPASRWALHSSGTKVANGAGALRESHVVQPWFTPGANGQYAILSKRAAGISDLVGAAGNSPRDAVLLLMAEQMHALVEQQAKAISGIDIDKIIVWEGGGPNGGLSSFVRSLATHPFRRSTIPPRAPASNFPRFSVRSRQTMTQSSRKSALRLMTRNRCRALIPATPTRPQLRPFRVTSVPITSSRSGGRKPRPTPTTRSPGWCSPDFVNSSFSELFADGLLAFIPLIARSEGPPAADTESADAADNRSTGQHHNRLRGSEDCITWI